MGTVRFSAFLLHAARVCALLLVASAAHAQNHVFPEDEYKNLTRISETVTPAGEHPFGEQISLYDGTLSFAQTDIALPGNGPTLSLGRTLSIRGASESQRASDGAFADWDIDLPRISTLVATGWKVAGGSDQYARCSHFSAPPNEPAQPGGAPWLPEAWWNGYHLVIPGQGSQDLLKRTGENTQTPTMPGLSFPIVTRGQWQVACLSGVDNAPGEGFLAVSPDGTRYRFEHLTTRWAPKLERPWGTGPAPPDAGPVPQVTPYDDILRAEASLLVTRIEDRFGNVLSFSYNGARLTGISASDGRTLAVTYIGATPRIQSITLMPGTATARTWTYQYGTTSAATGSYPTLIGVTRPDGSHWTFGLADWLTRAYVQIDALEGCSAISSVDDAITWTGTMTTPSGLTGSFRIRPAVRGLSDVPHQCWGGTQPNHEDGFATLPRVSYPLVVDQVRWSGAGLPAAGWTWNYAYAPANISWDDECTSTCATTATTTVADPGGQATVRVFSNRFGITQGQLQSVTVHSAGPASAVLRATTFAYAVPDTGPWPTRYGDSLQPRTNRAQTEQVAPQNQRQIVEDGTTYTWQATQFNAYAQVTQTSRDNNFDSQAALVETDTWRNDATQWVLGQPVDHVNVNTGETVSHHVYNTDGTLKERWAFGQKLMDYTWHTNGLPWTFTDANNHTTTLTSYHRGIPQSILYADSKSQSLVVDDFGQIQSITDETGDTTSYDYDDAGRLERISYPDDTANGVTWADRTIDYQFITTAERGITEPHWKRSVSAGNYREVTYYSALWQPILIDTWDSTDPGDGENPADPGSHVNIRMGYDYAGRAVFQSYAVGGSPSLGSITAGTTADFDALGRVTATAQASELGILTTTTAYLAGNKVKVTDPRGFATTTTYQAFDQPAYDAPTRVAFADGTVTTVSRDLYGKPLAMTQAGTYLGSPMAVTHTFAYDAHQRLCLQTDPESGQSVFGYDAAGNLAWSAEGQFGWSACPTATAVPASALVTRSYDARNRLIAIDYPTGTPDTAFTYYDDGKLHFATRDASGAQPASTWTLDYFNRGLLRSETLTANVGGVQNFALGYTYTSEGSLAQVAYPSGLVTALVPDSLGRPTQVGSYATNLTYAPGGQLTALDAGNGVHATWSYNARQLLAHTTYSLSGSDLTDRALSYDANGNLSGIIDAVVPSNGCTSPDGIFCATFECGAADTIFCATFDPPTPYQGTGTWAYSYDVLDRLTAISNPYADDAFSYDPLGNLRTSSDLGQFDYGADNRISQRTSTGGGVYNFQWNPRGDLTSDGERSWTWNLADELMGDSAGGSYAYDARGWRLAKTRNGASTVYVYDHAHRLRLTWDPATGTETDYLYAGAQLIARKTGASVTWVQPDHQGSPLFETDATGTITRQPVYLGYGRTDAAGRSAIPGYTGAAMDATTGQTYLGARYLYHKRFTSPDPAPLDPTSPIGLNRYAYASDNPVRYTDPTGRCPECIGAVVGAGLEVIVEGAEIYAGTRTEFSETDIGISAVAGATGVGAVKLIGRASELGTLAKFAINRMMDGAVSAATQIAKTRNVSASNVALDIVAGAVVGDAAGARAAKAARSSVTGKILDRQADRAERIAAGSSRPARMRSATSARKAQQHYVNAAAARAGVVGSNAASSAAQVACEIGGGQC